MLKIFCKIFAIQLKHMKLLYHVVLISYKAYLHEIKTLTYNTLLVTKISQSMAYFTVNLKISKFC